MKKRIRKSKVTKGEKLLYASAFLCAISLVILKIFCGASISGLNMSVEVIKTDINVQEKKNESLNMKVNELTSFENIKDIVSDMGLAYNNENIIVVND